MADTSQLPAPHMEYWEWQAQAAGLSEDERADALGVQLLRYPARKSDAQIRRR